MVLLQKITDKNTVLISYDIFDSTRKTVITTTYSELFFLERDFC